MHITLQHFLLSLEYCKYIKEIVFFIFPRIKFQFFLGFLIYNTIILYKNRHIVLYVHLLNEKIVWIPFLGYTGISIRQQGILRTLTFIRDLKKLQILAPLYIKVREILYLFCVHYENLHHGHVQQA